MPRIPAVPDAEAGALGRLAYRYARCRFGKVPTPFAVWRHHPGLFWTAAASESAVERVATRLPDGLGQLAMHRVATRVACSWCVDFSAMLAGESGVDPDRLRRAGTDGASEDPTLSELERLTLSYADAMTATPGTVSDALVSALDERLGHAGLVELTHLVALENMRARFNSALGIGDQGFCAVPASGDLTAPPAAGPSPG